MARPEMIIVKGTSFIVADLKKSTLKNMLKFTKNSNVSDAIVTEAWEQVNPERVKTPKVELESNDSKEAED